MLNLQEFFIYQNESFKINQFFNKANNVLQYHSNFKMEGQTHRAIRPIIEHLSRQ